MTAKSKPRKGLGRGLGALIPPASEKPVDVLIPDRLGKNASGLEGGSARELLNPQRNVSRETSNENVSRETTELVEVPGATFVALPIEKIVANAKQPRQVFEQSDIDQLAASIREVGVLQPIVVRPIDQDSYELVMGERRLRAVQVAGLDEIPAIVREVEDEDLLRDALLENLHRVQLNPLEEAAAYQQLLRDFGCTQEQLSDRIARSRPQIANTLRLLKLPASVQQRVAAGIISAGHARAILSLDSPEQMEVLTQRVVTEGISVRGTEELARLMKDGDGAKRRGLNERKPPSAFALQVANAIADRLDTSVTVTEGKKRGKITITFADEEDLARITEILSGTVSQ